MEEPGPAYWTQPIGILTALVLAVSVFAAFVALFRLIGARRKIEATVTAKNYFPDVKALLVNMTMGQGWHGHKPGQFAFLGSSSRWSSHPFTTEQWNFDVEPSVGHKRRLESHSLILMQLSKGNV